MTKDDCPLVAVVGSSVTMGLFDDSLNPGWADRYRLGPTCLDRSLYDVLGTQDKPGVVRRQIDPGTGARTEAGGRTGAFLASLAAAAPDVLIIDFLIDSRLAATQGGSGCPGVRKVPVEDAVDAGSNPDCCVSGPQWWSACRGLGLLLTSACPGMKLVVNSARCCTSWFDSQGVHAFADDSMHSVNEAWSALESGFLACVPQAVVLDTMAGLIRSDPRQPGTLPGLQYERAYYGQFDRQLERAISPEGAVCQDSLDMIGRDLGIDQAPPADDYLARYETLVETRGYQSSGFVLLSAHEPVESGLAFARRWPRSRVVVLDLLQQVSGRQAYGNLTVLPVSSARAMHEALAPLRDLAVMIDDGTHLASEQVRFFREFFPHLRDCGTYVVEDLPTLTQPGDPDSKNENILQVLERLAGPTPGRADANLARAIGSVEIEEGRLAFVTRRGTAWVKAPESYLLAPIAAGRGGHWLAREETRESGRPITVPPPASVSPDKFVGRFHTSYQLPDLRIREYRWASVAPAQVAFVEGVYLPESFRLYRHGRLHNRQVKDVGPGCAEPIHQTARDGRPLFGTYFHLDSEHAGTYGHLVTEVVSRLWAWDEVKQRYPDCTALVSAPEGESEPAPWYLTMLEAWGIRATDVAVVRDVTRVERLIGATPMFSNPTVAHPGLQSVWTRLADGFAVHASKREWPARVFVSRSPEARRHCTNDGVVHDLFRSHGFEVVLPEQWSLADQAALFASAECVAGFGGSAMLTSIFCRRGVPRIVINAEGYDAVNEYLIASVQDAPVHYFYCPAQIPVGPAWSEAAFLSDFHFDVERDGDRLERLLKQIDRR